jgi:thiamine pyridinylase
MPKLKFTRCYVLIFVLLFALLAVSPALAHKRRLAKAHHEAQITSLNLALYEYVPRLDQFKQVITAAWAQQAPGIQLNYVDWDCYSQDPPKNLDVFVFDGIFLDYFVASGFLSPLQPNEINNPADFLPYALNDSKIGNVNYAIPQIGCGSILFYRKGDTALQRATTYL